MQTPLSVILTSLELLVEPEVDAEMRAQLGARALPRARHLERLIQQFLDRSRLAVGTPIRATPERTDLVALVSEVVAAYPEVSFSAPARAMVARRDPPLTQQILHSLLTNSVRAARGAVRARIREVPPAGGDPAGAYDVEVHDDGGPRLLGRPGRDLRAPRDGGGLTCTCCWRTTTTTTSASW